MEKIDKENEALDSALRASAERLTPAQIERTIKQVLEDTGVARVKAYLHTCVHCGLCCTACHLYHSHDHHPHHTPAAKVKDTMGEIVRRGGRVNSDFIRRAARIVYTECTLCRRCTMSCPFGLDTAYHILLARRICFLLGVVPPHLQDAVKGCPSQSPQEWIRPGDWIKSICDETATQGHQFRTPMVPFDREGADLMYLVTGEQALSYPQLTGMMNTLMAISGVKWTMASMETGENSDMALFLGDLDTMARIARRQYDTAMKLRVKRIVMGECGHAFRSVTHDCLGWLGWKTPPVPVLHAVDLYYDLITSGRLRIRHKIEEPVTVHDPCIIARDKALGRKLRSILRATCADFRDVTPRSEHNYCCGAGGGLIHSAPHCDSTRITAGKAKAHQLRATGATFVVTPCHTCYRGIGDIIAHYHLNMHPKFFLEILMKCVDPSPLSCTEK